MMNKVLGSEGVVQHFVSNSHKYITTYNYCVAFQGVVWWSFLCALIDMIFNQEMKGSMWAAANQ